MDFGFETREIIFSNCVMYVCGVLHADKIKRYVMMNHTRTVLLEVSKNLADENNFVSSSK